MSKYFKTKAGSLEEAVLAAVTPKQIEEGKLPPALQKAIDKKNGKKTDDEDAVSEKKANYINLKFNSPADTKKAVKWLKDNLPENDQGFAGMIAKGNFIDFEDVDDADKLMSQLKKAGFKFKVDHRESVSETNKNDKSDDGEGLDAVQPKAVKKKFADRKDKDIDNDGDTDSSDKFLHKKRKAISKSMKEDVSNIADVITAMWGEAADKMDDKKKQLVCEDCGKVHEGKCAEEKDGKTMTGKPMSKVEVSVKEKD